jgi:signal transduction histidine kinase
MLSKAIPDPERLMALPNGSFDELDARALLDGARERVRASADAKDVDVLIYCTCGHVWAHAGALAEALHQLLENAIHATRKGYPVVVDARETSEGDVLFQIQDTGGGLEKPGRRVALASAIIEQHGGLLRFESEVGVGTTATVWLPRMVARDVPANTGAARRGR